MEFLLLGLIFGSMTITMPGPISVSLVQVATLQGRSLGTQAGIGVAGADALLAIVALAVVSMSAAIPAAFFAFAQMLTALVLVGFGVALVARPVAVENRATEVSNPMRFFLLLTTLTPTTIGTWIAVLAAMPFASDPSSLTYFALGVVVVSAIWYPSLGLGAGFIGPRMTPRALRVGTRVGGIATIGLGLWAVAGI